MDIKTQRLLLDERIVVPGVVDSFIIRLDGKAIGRIAICANEEITYEVCKEYQAKGYATEALKEVMKIALKNDKKPLLQIHRNNIASQKVAQKAGFYIHSNNGEWDEWRATKKPE